MHLSKGRFFKGVILLFLSVVFTEMLSAQTVPALAIADPGSFGYKAGFFKENGLAALKEVPSLGAMLVWRGKGLVYEQYFNGANNNTTFDVKSVTKCVTSALAGIVNQQGLLPGLNTPVLSVLPEYSKTLSCNKNIWYPELKEITDSLKRLLTLKHLLTMQTGFLWDDNNPAVHRAFQVSSDPVKFMLERPYEAPPGTVFRYCTGSCHVLSAVLQKRIGISLQKYADSMLFKPAGMNITSWPEDETGIPSGGSAMCMNAQSMMRFGLLYLNKGRVNGQQLIDQRWIEESTSEQVVLNQWDVMPGANGYGYYWWRRITNGHQAYVASGYGGQLICIVPDLDLVIVTACLINENNQGRSDIKRLHKFIDRIVKASVAAN